MGGLRGATQHPMRRMQRVLEQQFIVQKSATWDHHISAEIDCHELLKDSGSVKSLVMLREIGYCGW